MRAVSIRSITSITSLTLFSVSILGMSLHAADWPQYRGPNRDGVSLETGLLPKWPAAGPRLDWTIDDLGVGYSGPVVVGDQLFISGGSNDSEFLMARDLKAGGKLIWSARIGPLFSWKGNSWNVGPNASPTVDGESVYALGGFGDLICVEIASGKERWRVNLPRDFGGAVNPIGGGLEDPTPLGWGYAAAPLVAGDKLISVPGGRGGLLAALDKKTGKLLWRSKENTERASYSSPIATEIGGVQQLIQVTNAGIVGISLSDGKLLWSYHRERPFDDVVIATPLIHGDMVYASVGFGEGCDLIRITVSNSVFKATKVYASKEVQNRDGGLVLIGKNIFGHSEKDGWICQDFAKGNVLWTEMRALGRGSVVAAEGLLYCCAEKGGTIALVKPVDSGWNEISRFQLPRESKMRLPSGGLWTHPVVANGYLYIRDQELLFRYDIKK